MKTITTIAVFCMILFAGPSMKGQVLLAKWTFPTGTPGDSLADGGIPSNLSMAINTEGGTSAIDFSKNGFTTKSAQATGWDNGAMVKSWVVRLNTTGYKTLKLSSKQQSGGNNPGPRDYKVQYRLQNSTTWEDVPNSAMITANNWTTASLDNIPLPDSCSNRSLIYLRWVMTTNTNSSGDPVTPSGIDKIDDIFITGVDISTSIVEPSLTASVRVTPNPSSGPFMITSTVPLMQIELLDMNGRNIQTIAAGDGPQVMVDPGSISRGTYILRIQTNSGQIIIKKLIVI